jgi:hypothetical protein
MAISGDKTLAAVERTPGFGVFEAAGGAVPDIEIRMDAEHEAAGPAPGARLLHRFTVMGIVHSLWSQPDGWHFRMSTCSGETIVSMNHRAASHEVVMSGCEGHLCLGFAAWVAFAFPAVGRDRVPVHASAVMKDGSAVLFLGESGTGKSTQSGLWTRYVAGATLLNDDSPVVTAPADGTVTASGSPWSGKTHCYIPLTVPLKALVRLRQGPRNRIERLGGLRAIGALYPSCPPLLAHDPGLSARMLSTVGRIIAQVPVWELECRPDRAAAETAYETIYGTP